MLRAKPDVRDFAKALSIIYQPIRIPHAPEPASSILSILKRGGIQLADAALQRGGLFLFPTAYKKWNTTLSDVARIHSTLA